MRTASVSNNRSKIGLNRTGIATSPDAAAELVAATQETRPSQAGNASGMAEVRIAYAREGEPLGSMPPPATLKGIAKTTFKLVQGKNATVLLDKMAERLAFERTGTRLYDALLSKLEAYGSWPDGPGREELESIRDEERQHFSMLRDSLQSMGADPTAMTPSADVHAVASIGLPAVLSDPRTNLQQCLEVILHAELVDNDCWENLIDLALALGADDLADKFEAALDQEREHLRLVRLWVGASLSRQAAGGMAESFTNRATARTKAANAILASGTAQKAVARTASPRTGRADQEETEAEQEGPAKPRQRRPASRAAATSDRKLTSARRTAPERATKPPATKARGTKAAGSKARATKVAGRASGARRSGR